MTVSRRPSGFTEGILGARHCWSSPLTNDFDGALGSGPPSLTPARGDTGADTNEVIGGDADSCGVLPADRAPTVEQDLLPGRTYRGAVLGYQFFAEQDATPTAVRFDFDPGVSGASTDTRYPSSVFWSMS